MEAVSEVILRNQARLQPGALFLINPARDMLYSRLQAKNHPVRLFTQNFGDHRWLQSAGPQVDFGVIPQVTPEVQTIILSLPREKDRLSMLLHALATQIPESVRLWLVGENRAGIKSSPKLMRQYFKRVDKLDSARHCGLFEASAPTDLAAFSLSDFERSWPHPFGGRQLMLRTLPGVFAHGRLDKGTALLFEVLETLRPAGKILDFGCGSGVIGLSLLNAGACGEMTLLDDSALAIESSARSMQANGIEAGLLPSDGLSELTGRFDWIISNPPFHRGIRSDFEIARDFFRSAGTFLTEKGRILIVSNKHLPYAHWLRAHYAKVKILASSREYAITQASNPK
jgi:16S rRNA (guanine1207-N2)-methyltransferase